MKFVASNDVSIGDTSLVGYVYAKYANLVKVFGEPQCGPNDADDKVTCEWTIEFDDGTVATIYDWKLYNTPMYAYDWHVGGVDKRAEKLVNEAFREGMLNNS